MVRVLKCLAYINTFDDLCEIHIIDDSIWCPIVNAMHVGSDRKIVSLSSIRLNCSAYIAIDATC